MKSLDTSSQGDIWNVHNKTLRAISRSAVKTTDEERGPKLTPGTLALCKRDLVILAVFFVFAVSFIVRYPMLTQDFYAY